MVKKLWVLCEEPTEYTLDKVRCVFEPMGADVAWRRAASELSPAGAKDALEGMSFIRRLWRVMRAVHTHEALLLNGFAGKVHWMCIILNALLWHRPLGFAVDTQAGESFQECRGMERGSFRRTIRNAFLGWLFKRPYVYGLPGGSGAHVEFFRSHGMADERIFVLPMVVAGARYRRRAPREVGGAVRFGYIGRLEERKRVAAALSAFFVCVCSGMNVEFEVVGDGPGRASLEEVFAHVPGVTFAGALYGEAKVKALHRFDVLVLPSAYEPWGLVVNEALEAGVPVIVSDRVGARKDLVEGERPTGLVVAVEEKGALVAAMRRLAEDAALREEMASAAVERMRGWSMPQAKAALDRWLRSVARGS